MAAMNVSKFGVGIQKGNPVYAITVREHALAYLL
jgi:hypothetical protein